MRILLIHILTFVLFASFCKAQQVISLKEMTTIMQKTNSIYSQKEYAVALEVYTYKGHYAIIPEDQSSGFIRKKNSITEQSLNQVYTLQNELMKLMVDSTENIVGITYPDTASLFFTPDDNFFNKYNRFVLKVTHTEIKNGVQLLNIFYREGLPYEKITIKLNNSFAEEITFYYAEKVEYETTDGTLAAEKPKMRVVLKIMPSIGKLNYNMSDIAYKGNGGYRLTEKFKNFKLIDFRYTSNARATY
ncbi:MAG: hypothetical protein KFKLKKLM_02057 [Flavobacteriales bacterium]|nr:hypothetical protein [Flavobacteriales bacterium]